MFSMDDGIFHKILSVLTNNVLDLNNVMVGSFIFCTFVMHREYNNIIKGKVTWTINI